MTKLPKGRNDQHKLDYSLITENIYIGSDLCKGNVCPIHSGEFKKLGVCVEINLTAEKKEVPPNDIISYVWMPVVDGYPPSPDQLMFGTAAINEAVRLKETVYVHCKNGHGRSPTLVASYLIRFKNMSAQKAMDLVCLKRSEVHFEKEQQKALFEFEKLWK